MTTSESLNGFYIFGKEGASVSSYFGLVESLHNKVQPRVPFLRLHIYMAKNSHIVKLSQKRYSINFQGFKNVNSMLAGSMQRQQ